MIGQPDGVRGQRCLHLCRFGRRRRGAAWEAHVRFQRAAQSRVQTAAKPVGQCVHGQKINGEFVHGCVSSDKAPAGRAGDAPGWRERVSAGHVCGEIAGCLYLSLLLKKYKRQPSKAADTRHFIRRPPAPRSAHWRYGARQIRHLKRAGR